MKSTFRIPVFLFLFAGAVQIWMPLQSLAAQSLKDLKGLSAEETEQLFGPPDQRQETRPGRETWKYGRSLILFRDSKISAWSDAGELRRRVKLSRVSGKDTRVKQEQEHWKNPWTLQEPLSNRALLYEIIAQSETTENMQASDIVDEPKAEIKGKKAVKTPES